MIEYLKKIRDFFLGPSIKVVQRTDFNWIGPLPKKVTWDWAAANCPVTPMQHDIPPTHCPECGEKLVQKNFDPILIDENGGDIYTISAVITQTCPNQHGSWVEWI
jgi:hypothetical protein